MVKNAHIYFLKSGFSHADRLGGDSSLLSPQRIQTVICEGTDIFDMLPEVRFIFPSIVVSMSETDNSVLSIQAYSVSLYPQDSLDLTLAFCLSTATCCN